MNDAVRTLQKAAGLSPEEKAIQQELARAIQKRDNMIEKERAMYKRMMEGKPASTSNKTKSKSETSSWKNVRYSNFIYYTLYLSKHTDAGHTDAGHTDAGHT